MDDRRAVAWLHRRAGFGLHPDELDAAAARGPAAELDRLLTPPEPPAGDDWDDARLPLDPKDRDARRYAIHRWLDLMVGSTRPLVDRMAWLWHGHLVSALDKVRIARLMVDQVRLLRRAGLGSFPDLLSAVAIDPAMLIYLDGRESTGRAPNENFARELMELFTLGVGQYVEADVRAGAAALTGWRLRPRQGRVALDPARHDDAPQRYLGVEGVHDLAGVVSALAAHPALPPFVSGAVAAELLGPSDPAAVAPLAGAFTASGLRIDALVRAALEAGLAGRSGPVVLGPVPWLVTAQRVTGAVLEPAARLVGLRSAGQLPMLPPNVAGWPGGPAWFASATVVSRANLAAAVAAATEDGQPVLEAAGAGAGPLAEVLALPDPGFGPATAAALSRAASARERLALALTSPEVVLA